MVVFRRNFDVNHIFILTPIALEEEGEVALRILGKRVQVNTIGSRDNVYTTTEMGAVSAEKAEPISKARVELIE